MGVLAPHLIMMYDMTYGQHQLVYNFTSFTLASMMATTMFIWIRMWGVKEELRTAMTITGLVTFIAFYHYVRIFNSWVDAYKFPDQATGEDAAPTLTGVPFLLMELVLVMDMSKEEKQRNSAILGTAAGFMILFGYPGELITEGPQLGTRWMFWAVSMCPFLYIVYTLLKGLGGAMAAEELKDKERISRGEVEVAPLIRKAQIMTVVSWCTYPIVYIFPMIGNTGAGSVVGIQIGYCISDIISKCGVGLLTYTICAAKSN